MASVFAHPVAGQPRPGWYAWRPAAGAELPDFAVEVVLTVERPSPGADECRPEAVLLPGADECRPEAVLLCRADECRPEAVLLCRAPAVTPSWLDAATAGAREVEILAGVRRRAELGLRPPLALPGLDPISPTALLRHLRAAGRRGLVPAWPAESSDVWTTGVWQEGPGAVLHCWDGPQPSAQAVVVLHGQGDPELLTPRPGGAVIVRAWQVGRVWGVVCAVVLGATRALDLGREATRLAAAAGAAGWQASVPRHADAVATARAGDPRQPIPLNAARRVTQEELVALLGRCLQTGQVPAGDPRCDNAPVPVPPVARRERLAKVLDDLDEVPDPGAAGPLAG